MEKREGGEERKVAENEDPKFGRLRKEVEQWGRGGGVMTIDQEMRGGEQIRGKIKGRKDRLHRRGEDGWTSKKLQTQKWTTFSWRPPTERRIGRDSE